MSFSHNYSLSDRWLHRMALGIRPLAEMSFDLDQRASGASAATPDPSRGAPVFVSGLARSGTTILLRHLHDQGCFRSLCYRDMPFPLAPNLWKRLSGRWRRAMTQQDRPHGDGIRVDADSPEALEEIFWRVRCGADYILPQGLTIHRPDAGDIAAFRHYVAAILASGEPGRARYLSKNNNNILRLPALRMAFPDAFFLLPFRHPVAQALSLWRQHRHFCALQVEAPFIRAYMGWLAHHEFGLDHRPFLFGYPPPPRFNPDMPDYWLHLWIGVHARLIGERGERVAFVSHEGLCADPARWQALLDWLEVEARVVPQFRPSPLMDAQLFDLGLVRRAERLHADLRALSL